MIVNAARCLSNDLACFVGIGLPSTAANLARRLHAPDCVLIYESGCIGSKPTRLPLSIGDGELAETSDAVVSVPEIFAYWLQAGRIDVGFLGAAQLDRFGNINSTVIGDYDHPTTRLPGCRRRAGDRGVGRRGHRHHPPEPAILRRALRLRDLGGLRPPRRRPPAPRPAGRRTADRDHRPGHPPARPGDLRARPDRPAPRPHRGAGPATPRAGRSPSPRRSRSPRPRRTRSWPRWRR